MRAGSCLRVELHRPRVLERQIETFHRAVIERHVRRLARLRGRDREAVVLTRDEHATGRALENWMVRPAVSEGKLEGLVPGGQCKELVAEADSEQRHTADQVTNDGDLVQEWFRVAGAVGEEHPVEA